MKNSTTRIISGAAMVAIMVGCYLAGRWSFAALMLFIMFMMLKEFLDMNIGSGLEFGRILTVAGGLGTFLVVFFCRSMALEPQVLLLCLVPPMVLMVQSLFVPREQFADYSYLYTAFLYIVLPICSFNLLCFSSNGEYSGKLLLSFYLIIGACDTGAYFLGTALGQREGSRKLFPSISPKKSWWGLWGGMIAGVIAAALLKLVRLMDMPMGHAMAIGALMCVAGVLGDLVESQWKRLRGVKDSSNFIPGHGGLLDRFDSALLAVPAAAVYMALAGLLDI